MAKKIVFSRKAFVDIDRIVEFNNLRNKSNSYSIKFVKTLNKQLQLLGKQPFIGFVTDEQTNYFLFGITITFSILILNPVSK